MAVRSSLALGALLALLAVALPGVSPRADASGPVPVNQGVVLHSGHGVTVISVERIGSRQLLATIRPKALARPITVRILLPVGYQADSPRRYPVLYLYPGTSGHSYDWMTVGRAPQATRPFGLITVSSDIGFDGDGGGWFTNWVNQKTMLGPSQWETYDIHELIPWIDSNLATIRSRDGRAVAGLSQGGYGSTELAARHPDRFTELASFSGAPEIERDVPVRVGAALVIGGTMVGLNGVGPNAPFGPHGSDEINWRGHDPAELIPNLRPVGMWFATADGFPGKYDDPVTRPGEAIGAGIIESLTHISTDTFLMHLRRAGLSAVVYDYGTGTHTWPYWARDLRRFLPVLMRRFAHPVAAPARAQYMSIEPTWRQWGWWFRARRSQRLQFAMLRDATGSGFVLRASGDDVMTTPATYQPGAVYQVRVGPRDRQVRALRSGRLRIAVPLGPTVREVRVRIAGPARLEP